MTSENDELGEMLADGWEVCGYDVSMMAAGAVAQYILLRKDNSLATFTVLNNGAREIARSASVLTPKQEPPPKKGFFG